MKILITGANGFIGGHLVPSLLAAGHQLVGTVRDASEPAPVCGIETVIAPLDDANAWTRVVTSARPDAVVHLAAVANVTHGDPTELYRMNVVGTEHLLKAVDGLGTAPSVLLLSTAAVYGNQERVVFDEQAPLRPANHYGLSKLAMELMAHHFSGRFPIRIVRPFNVIGRGQRDTFLVAKLVKHFLERAPEIQLGNVKPERDYVDVRDLCTAIGALIGQRPPEVDLVNVSSGVGVSIETLFEWLVELTGHRPSIVVNPQFVRKNEVWRIIGDNRKLHSLVSLPPLRTTRQTVEWMLGQAT